MVWSYITSGYIVYIKCILKHTCIKTWCTVYITGTPTEQSWPGINSNEDFVTYNYPEYRAETLSNHTPRWTHNCTSKMYHSQVHDWNSYIWPSPPTDELQNSLQGRAHHILFHTCKPKSCGPISVFPLFIVINAMFVYVLLSGLVVKVWRYCQSYCRSVNASQILCDVSVVWSLDLSHIWHFSYTRCSMSAQMNWHHCLGYNMPSRFQCVLGRTKEQH